MKKYNKIKLATVSTIFVLAIFLFMGGITGCYVIYPYGDKYSPNYVDPTYAKWKAEQAAQREHLYNYTQSAEFKQKYGGVSESDKVNSPKANSIIGTPYDSFSSIRNSVIGIPVTRPTQDIRVIIR